MIAMENAYAESTNKRQHDVIDYDVQCKSHRLALSDEQQQQEQQSNQAPTITDLDDICLTNIFNHLELKELLYVANANKLLLPAARCVYKRKFGKNTVRISGCDDLHPNTRAMARTGQVNMSTAPRENYPGSINIRHLKLTLTFLRCFGPSITRLSIFYNKCKSRRYQYVHHYINQYCAESLTEISFRDMPNIKVQHFDERPFVNVGCVNMSHCQLGKQLPCMVKWFPNLRTLKIENVRLNHRCVNASFPHLEQLKIIGHDHRGLNMDDVAELLPANRQLRKINITMSSNQAITINGLLDTIRENQLVDTLIVRTFFVTMSNELSAAEINRFVTEHPGLIVLDLLFKRFNANEANALHRQLTSSKTLNFSMSDSEYEKLQTIMDKGWTSQIHIGFVTMRRA